MRPGPSPPSRRRTQSKIAIEVARNQGAAGETGAENGLMGALMALMLKTSLSEGGLKQTPKTIA